MATGGFFVVVESDDYDTGVSFFHRARDLGLSPILFSTSPTRYRNLAEFDSVELGDMTERSVLDAIDRLGRDRVRGLWSLRDYWSGVVARIAKKIGLPGADPEPIEICCDKLRTRQVLAACGIDGVRFAHARSGTEAAEAARAFGCAVVLKPRSMGGGVGVRLCRDGEEARHHFEGLAARYASVRAEGLVVEEVVAGRQFSAQLFDGRALGITRQDVTPPPVFVTVGLEFPWTEDPRLHDALVEHAEKAIAAAGHRRGPASIDLRHDGTRPRLIEINPRLAGELIVENVRIATGIDLVEATICFACGLPYDLAPRHARGSATRWLLRGSSPVRAVGGRDEAAALGGVVHVGLFPDVYGRTGPVRQHKDRIGYVMTEAETPAEAGAIAERALRKLRIVPLTASDRWAAAVTRAFARARDLFAWHVHAPGAVTNGAALTHVLVDNEAAFAALEPDWEELFARAETRTPFQRYGWARLCWDRHRKIRGTRLCIVVLREGGRPVLIAPLVTRPCGFWHRELAFLDSFTPQYNDVLVASGDVARYTAYLWQALGRMTRLKRFAANWVRDDSPLAPNLATAASKEKSVFESPFIELAKFLNWNDYLQSLSSNLRHDHRRQQRLLARKGVVLRVSDEEHCAADMAWLFAAKHQWLERTGTKSKWLRMPGTEEFFAGAAREGMASGRTWLTVFATGDGEIIAACLGFREGARFYLSKIAYDRAWHSFSPARTLTLLAIERAFEQRLQRCDLMIGADAWKARLQTGTVSVRNRLIKFRPPPVRP